MEKFTWNMPVTESQAWEDERIPSGVYDYAYPEDPDLDGRATVWVFCNLMTPEEEGAEDYILSGKKERDRVWKKLWLLTTKPCTGSGRRGVMKKVHWSKVALWDSDGYSPDTDTLKRAMREFQAHGCISGYWMYNPTDCEHEDDGERVWDNINNEYRYPEDVGFTPEEIDFTGIEE